MLRGRRVAAIVVARMGSSRLPGKMLEALGEGSVLSTACERLRACEPIDEIIVATTSESLDDELASHAASIGLRVVRGSARDVVGRMCLAAEELAQQPDIIVRACADNPLLMPTVVAEAIDELVAAGADVITPFEHATYPFGYGLVVLTHEALLRIDRGAQHPTYREHVENYCFEHPEHFCVRYQVAPPELTCPELLLTLDWETDLSRIRSRMVALEGVAYEEQPAALLAEVRGAAVFVEGRDTGPMEEADLVLLSALPAGMDPVRPSRGTVIVEEYGVGETRCLGLRYAPGSRDGFPEGPIYLDPGSHPDHIGRVEFLRRVAETALPGLLAAPAREVAFAEPSAAMADKCATLDRRRGFASPEDAAFPPRVAIDLASSSGAGDLLERLLAELEAHPETRVLLRCGGELDPGAAAEAIRRLGSAHLGVQDGGEGDLFAEVCLGTDGRLRAGAGVVGSEREESISGFWNSASLRRARARALNDGEGTP